jgi:sterol desaturase/sphingolipid hydroxylase (fatty acid hydroxylase superfamily)
MDARPFTADLLRRILGRPNLDIGLPMLNLIALSRKAVVWLGKFLFPWLTLYGLIAFGLTHSAIYLEVFRRPGLQSFAYLLVINLVIQGLFTSALYVPFYTFKIQEARHRYTPKMPKNPSPGFMLNSQLYDNVILTMGSSVPIYTVYEYLLLLRPHTSGLAANPWYCLGVAFLTPIFVLIHFYYTHRLIHIPILYKYIHSVHHKNLNFMPWSGTAMHPVEHVIFYSALLVFFVIPASPFNVIFAAIFMGLNPGIGHHGFFKWEALGHENDHQFHFNHHRYCSVNFGGGPVPLDRWHGTLRKPAEPAQKPAEAGRKPAPPVAA